MKPLFDLTKRPYRHSYSSIKTYKECPAKYGYSYISKLPDPPSAAMMRGTRLHKLAEDYMNNRTGMIVPYDIRRIGLDIHQMRERGGKAEQTWLLDADWAPTDNLVDAKVKAIIDAHLINKDVLEITDYKSGREYPEHSSQLELYALIGLQRYPAVRRVEARALYIDSGRTGHERSIIRPMLPKLLGPWRDVVVCMDADREFLPSAGGVCSRCAYRSDKDGPCDGWRSAQ